MSFFRKARVSRSLLELLTPHEAPFVTLERWGPATDGAYIVPVELMLQSKTMVSGGVSDNVHFEAEIARRNPAIRIGLFDHTIDAAPEHTPPNATWHPYGLGNEEGFLSLEEAAERSGAEASGHLAVKLDIESAEWGLIESTPKPFWECVDVLVLEAHGFADRQSWQRYQNALSIVNKELLLVHVHGNNYSPNVHFKREHVYVPWTLELTYLNRRFIPSGHVPVKWKHPGPTSLDRPNSPLAEDLVLNYWFLPSFPFLRRLLKNIPHIFSFK